ncbi:MAG: adenylyl-sulfate kinase, partial [Gammaproteobacteria bacterium]|nr:adenylyl-sulfate kinase [Gammaproteobacteria bacterium]
FNTDHRKFIVADTPGHEQYTRNMVTGASTADVAVILLDATQGVLTQTRRHSFIASLLGIKHVVLAVNKMDLANFDKKTYDDIVEEYRAFSRDLSFETITEIPMSALEGDNVIQRSSQTTWYTGPTLLGFLETVEVGRSQLDHPFRFPVQWVNRPSHEFRGYTGTIVAGQVEKGQAIRVLPSGEMANVDEIILYKTKLDKAVADQAVTITLDREVDISRGDVIVAADEPCQASDQFEVSLVWMDQEEGFIGRNYWMIIGTTKVNATIRDIKFKYNINTFEHISCQSLALNEISEVTLSVDKDVPYEAYQSCKAMGAFVLIDRYSHATVGAGMINFALRRAENVHRQALEIDKKARAKLNGHPGRALWFTGLSGSGKSTVANALEQALHEKGLHTYILDGDNVRHGLNRDLGFTDADRIENVRRVAEVTKLMVDAGIVVITSFISPFRSERQMARELFDAGEFIEVYVNVTLDQAEKRDPKGLYKKARRGELPNFTGIDSAYEEPEIPEIELKTGEQSVEECVEQILKFL